MEKSLMAKPIFSPSHKEKGNLENIHKDYLPLWIKQEWGNYAATRWRNTPDRATSGLFPEQSPQCIVGGKIYFE
jgi:hypothetical protein